MKLAGVVINLGILFAALWASQPSRTLAQDEPPEMSFDQDIEFDMEEFEGFVASVAKDIAASFGSDENGQIAVTIKHAIVFPTWSDLDAQRLTNDAKIDLVSKWLEGLVASDMN